VFCPFSSEARTGYLLIPIHLFTFLMKHCLTYLWKPAALLLLVAATACERVEMAPSVPTPTAAAATTNVYGDVSLDADPFSTGSTLRVKWDPGIFYGTLPSFTNLETVATIEFRQNGILKLSSRHIPVHFEDLCGCNIATGYIDYVVPQCLPAGAYTIIVKTEGNGKTLMLESTPGQHITDLQINGTAVVTARTPYAARTAPVQLAYAPLSAFTWKAVDFNHASYQAPPMRAFLVDQSSGVAYQVFTEAQVGASTQNPQNPVIGFENDGDDYLYVGEEVSRGVFAVPNGVYRLMIDNGSLVSTYPFPVSLSAYRHAVSALNMTVAN
jgi:hypothetical protein